MYKLLIVVYALAEIYHGKIQELNLLFAVVDVDLVSELSPAVCPRGTELCIVHMGLTYLETQLVLRFSTAELKKLKIFLSMKTLVPNLYVGFSLE